MSVAFQKSWRSSSSAGNPVPLCSREIFTKLCRLINAGEGAFQDSFHAIVITAKLMYLMEHHWQHYCLGRDSALMLLVVAWSFCLHSQSWTSRTVGIWHPEKCLLGSRTGKLEHNWWMQVICEAALDVNRCEEDTGVVSFLFDIPWPTSLPYSAPVETGCCFLSIYIRWLCSQKLETAT